MLTLISAIVAITAITVAIFTYLWATRRCRLQSAEIDTTRKTVRDLSVLNEMVSEMNAILEREKFFDSFLQKVKILLRAEKSAVIILENGSTKVKEFITSMGDSGGCKVELRGLLKRIVEEQSPVRVKDITMAEGFMGLPETHPDIRSLLAVPLLLRGKTIGVLMVTDKTTGETFSPEDEDLLLNASFHIALAVEKLWFYDKLQELANLDGLTNLYNHRAFQDRLDEEIERARRGGHSLALLMCDIDLFKVFNDTYGHLAGDRILKEVAKVIKESIRKMDVPARYGGEEFAVILPETTLQGAFLVAERIRQEVSARKIDYDRQKIGVTISVGVALYPEDGKDKKSLLAAADLALYHAKRSGRNRVSTYSEFVAESMV